MAGVAVVYGLGICDQMVRDYREFPRGFVVHDALIRAHAGKRTAGGYQWSARWLSLRRGFASGDATSDLIGAGPLQPEA